MTEICYIHAGTHRTATTYLQTFLSLNQELLQNEGLYIPRTGRPDPCSGHHTIAMELLSDAAGEPGGSHLTRLVEELAGRDAPRACISSENFVLLNNRPAALQRLVDALRRLDYTVKFIFYLRPQVDYGESLYAELLKHELTFGFDEYWSEFLSQGAFPFGLGEFPLDYARMLAAFARVVGKQDIIIRPYRPGRPTDIAADFVSLMLPAGKLVDGRYEFPAGGQNAAASLSDLLFLFLRNNLKDMNATEDDLARYVDLHSTGLPSTFAPLRFTQIVAAGASLIVSNLKVLATYGVFVSVVSKSRLITSLAAELPDHAGLRSVGQLFSRPPRLPPAE